MLCREKEGTHQVPPITRKMNETGPLACSTMDAGPPKVNMGWVQHGWFAVELWHATCDLVHELE